MAQPPTSNPLPSGGVSFPLPMHGTASPRAPSAISSQITDGMSENGDDIFRDSPNRPQRPGTATTVEHGRPTSALSSQTRPSTRAPPSRRGYPGNLTSPRFGTSVGSSSRPGSSTSKTSRSHVPVLASQAFFKPMSSQRLQAQRSLRPYRNQPDIGSDVASETEASVRRHSLVTNTTDGQEEVFSRLQGPLGSRLQYTAPGGQNALAEQEPTPRNVGGGDRPVQDSMYVNIDGQRDSARPRTLRGFSANFLRAKHTSAEGSKGQFRLPSTPGSPITPHAAIQSTPESGLNYQFFSGNAVFWLGGRIQNTRDRPINIVSAAIVLLPSILFFVYSAPYLSQHVSPAIPVFYAYFFFISMSSLIHASVTNPGIMPRNLHHVPPGRSEDPLEVPPPLSQWVTVKSKASPDAAMMEVPVKYCKTCNIWRPPRCHHCRLCDSCIENQDHHCVWVNNCIGRRNYRYFFGFIGVGSLLGIFLTFASLGHCLRYASSNHISFRDSINVNRVPFAMFIYGLVATPYPICLALYHLQLTARGETTREALTAKKFPVNQRHRPFTQGNFFKNWLAVFLRPRTPTYLQFKAPYEPGDQRFGPKRANDWWRIQKSQQTPSDVEMLDVSATKAI